MYNYSLTQWILFFFIYCFLGWIWECIYVSAKLSFKNKKLEFVNRGFLNGPFLPIYGFAAISILLTTIPLKDNATAVCLVGSLTATTFELITGTTMERLFKVKYWDYSDWPLNFKGHICFFVSMFWGLFSILLVQVIHVPIENILFEIPTLLCEIAAFILIGIFVYDYTTSFREAMDLKEILESLTENNEAIKKIERRFDAVVAFSLIPNKDEIAEITENIKNKISHNIEMLKEKNEKRIVRLKEHLQFPEFVRIPDRLEILRELEECKLRILKNTNRQYLNAIKQLRRNPEVKSEKYREVLESLKDILKK